MLWFVVWLMLYNKYLFFSYFRFILFEILKILVVKQLKMVCGFIYKYVYGGDRFVLNIYRMFLNIEYLEVKIFILVVCFQV